MPERHGQKVSQYRTIPERDGQTDGQTDMVNQDRAVSMLTRQKK